MNNRSDGAVYSLFIGVFVLWLVSCGVFYYYFSEFGVLLSILLGSLVFLFVLFLIGSIVYGIDRLKSIGKKKEQREQLKIIADGEYEFPVLEFYQTCNVFNCVNLDSEFCIEKARRVAEGILKKNNIPPEYFNLYNSNSKLAEYMASGKKLELEKEEQERQELERIAKTPHEANLNNEEKEAFFMQNIVEKLFGRDKREFMLNNAISAIEKKIKSINEAQKEALKIGTIISQSAMQEKTNDWAIAGGIASGIAGPAAGLAVAANTMHKNAEIEERNRQNQAVASKLAVNVTSSLYAAAGDTTSLSTHKNELKTELEKLSEKVVMSGIEQSKIIQSLKIVNYSIKGTNSNALLVSVLLKNDLSIKDIPAGVSLTTDGSLKGEIYAGEMLVDTVVIPLPLFGVVCSQEEYANSICSKYSKNGEPYTLKLQANKLWVMEL